MARKQLIVTPEVGQQVDKKERLKTLIADYGVQNDQLKVLKKSVDTANAELKILMPELLKQDEDGNYISESGDYTATLQIQDRSTMNEEKLIEWLKKNNLAKGIVKRREYVDSKALEDAIYNHVITEEQVVEMEICKDPKTVPVLTIKKKGGKK